MEHQEIYEWLKELAFKNCNKENREQIFWFFEDILEDEIKVEKQEDEIERLNNIINKFNKLIENEINESKLEDNYERVDSLEYCLATLKELKGDSSNE